MNDTMNSLELELHRFRLEKLQSIAERYFDALFQVTTIELLLDSDETDTVRRMPVLVIDNERRSH